jgi:hypothetical protein
VAGIEAFTVARGNERSDTRARQFDDELVSDEHGACLVGIVPEQVAET